MVFIFFFLYQEGISAMYLFNFDGLDIWAFDIIFLLLFMNRYFIINIYKHQKYSIVFILIMTTPLLVISTFFPYTNHKDINNSNEYLFMRDKDTYEIIKIMTGSTFYGILIFSIFIFLSCIISYARVKSKVLIDFYYISPYKIIFDIGIIGFTLISIALAFTTSFSCKGNEKIKYYCLVKKEENPNDYYYDNILIYFDKFINNWDNRHILEIFLYTPLYFIISFFEMVFELLTIMYLNPIYLLIRDNLYYFFIKIIIILCLVNQNFEHYITLKQLLILEICEIFALLGYSVYLEIIELRLFELEKDLKKNIIKRGDRESKGNLLDSSDDAESEENENENENGNEFEKLTYTEASSIEEKNK